MIEESLQYQEVDLITRKSDQETYPYFNYRQRPFNSFPQKKKAHGKIKLHQRNKAYITYHLQLNPCRYCMQRFSMHFSR